MIKVIVLAVVGLLVGLGGTSGMAVMKAKKVAAHVADSLAAHADSTGAKGEHGGKPSKAQDAEPVAKASAVAEHAPATTPADSVAATAHGPALRTDSAAAPANTDSHTAAPKSEPPAPAKTLAHAPATKAAAKAPLPKITPSPASPDQASATNAAPASGRLAKIFGAMSAKDAARVLEQMDDNDVQTVLSGLNDRQAAAILAGFPPARAAAISKATLRKKGTS